MRPPSAAWRREVLRGALTARQGHVPSLAGAGRRAGAPSWQGQASNFFLPRGRFRHNPAHLAGISSDDGLSIPPASAASRR